MSLAAAQCDARVIQPKRDGIAPHQPFMQDMEARTFNKAHLQQSPFQFLVTDLAGAVMAFRRDTLDQATVTFSQVTQAHGRPLSL